MLALQQNSIAYPIPMTQDISSKNTKNEILNAYQEALAEIKSLKQQSKKQVQQQNEKKAAVDEAIKATPDNLIGTISNVKIAISKSLDEIAEKLTSQQDKLNTLQKAIKAQEESLQTNYGIQAELETMDAILLAHKKTKHDLKQEIEAQYNAWKQEKQLQEKTQRETLEQLQKSRKREEDDYQYELKKARKKDEDDYKLKRQALERELLDKKAQFERDIAERERLISEHEAEFQQLKQASEAHPIILEKEVNAAIEKTKQELKQYYDYQAKLNEKEMTGKIALYQQTNQSLQDKIEEQKQIITELSQKSVHANDQVQHIALKAIESTSSQNFRGFGYDKKHQVETE